MANLFLDTLRSNPNARVLLDASTSVNGSVISGFVMQDFVFSGRNSFNSAMEAILGAGKAIDRGNSVLRAATAAAGWLGQNVASRTISAGDSVSAWVASDRPKFSIPLLFLAAKSDDNPLLQARQLLAYVYPGGDPLTVIQAPLGYGPQFTNWTGEGMVGVNIGQWFATPRWFVVSSLQLTVSQRTDYQGYPLYVGAAVEFEAYRTLTYSEVSQFFVDP